MSVKPYHPLRRLTVPMRALVAVAALLVAGCVAVPPSPTADEAPVGTVAAAFDRLDCPLSSCPVRATEGAQAVETQIAVDPADSRHLVVVAKAADRSIATAAASFDGGATWVQTTLPSKDLVTDPVVVFAPDGSILAVALGARPVGAFAVAPTGLSAFRSTDGGRSWTALGSVLPEGTRADHPWLGVDRERGIVYLAASLFPPDGTDFVHVLSTRDAGRTWSAPVVACEPCWAPELGVAPDGAVYVVSVTGVRPTPTGADSAILVRSDDGGATWNGPFVVAEGVSGKGSQFSCHGRASRWTGIPAVAAGPRAVVHVAYVAHAYPVPVDPRTIDLGCPDAPDWDVFVRTSADGGETWGEAVRVNDDGAPLASQATPAIARGPRGDVHVLWYDTRHDPAGRALDVYYAHSPDGARFDPNLRVTSASADDNGLLNDYIGLAATDEAAFLAFSLPSGADADVWTATVR